MSRKGEFCAMLPRQLPRQSDVTNTVCWTDAFKDAIDAHHFQVLHPAEPDLPEPVDHNSRSYDIGSVFLGANAGSLRRSLTFQGMNSQEGKVEMDWYVELESVDTLFFRPSCLGSCWAPGISTLLPHPKSVLIWLTLLGTGA